MLRKNVTQLMVVLWLACAAQTGFGEISNYFDDMEYASQAAFEVEWPLGFVGPSGSPLELSTEVSRSGSKSAKCDTDRQTSTHLFDELLPAGSMDIWVYDSLTPAAPAILWAEVGISDGSWAMVGLDENATNYKYRLVNEGFIDTGISRSQGWHHIQFTFGDPDVGGSIYLDGNHLLDTAKLGEGCKRIRLGSDTTKTTTELFYFDDVAYTFGLNPLEDDAETVALLHMDALTVIEANDVVLDDDSVNPGRDNNLFLGILPGTTAPNLTTGSDGVWGEALQLNGTTDIAVIPGTPWLGDTNQINAVNVEFWMRPSSPFLTGTLVSVPGVWEIYLDGRIYFRIWDANDGVVPLQGDGTTADTWWHVKASYQGGKMTLILNGQKVTRSAPLWKRADAIITVGNSADAASAFQGRVDDLKISIPPSQCGDWGYSRADINEDCQTDLVDFWHLAMDWSACTDPNNPADCVIIGP